MQHEPTKDNHGLPFNPFNSCCNPRPIGWISTVSKEDIDNLAPYSQFQNLTFEPPIVMFAANQSPDGNRKDSVVNAEHTGRLDVLQMQLLARLGYHDYTYINESFEMKIPDPDGNMAGDLEGRPE